ncbi:MAG: ATP-dependent DNA helicase RecG [Paludibacteraceae bacterium]|nr:ATP-dependent DNA helicase RecG [Paludibacteraceae bacterium]
MLDLRYKDITYCKGVGEKRAQLLKKELKIESALDLLHIYPYKYVDRSRFYQIRDIEDEETFVQIIGVITDYQTVGSGKSQRLTATFVDKLGDSIELVWFKGVQYLKLEIGVPYLLFGKPSSFNHSYNIVHPELERLRSQEQLSTRKGLEPHYNTSEKMKNGSLNSKAMRTIIQGLMPDLREGVPDTLPQDLREKYHLCSLTDALINIHFPPDSASMQRARERLKFEELFYIQLQILKQAKGHTMQSEGFVMPMVGSHFHDFYSHHLPFPLTGAQKRVIKEIHEDMKSGHQMNRLLQGDVGSGKTLVALMCALLAADNHYQTCIMAPTEILANQHMETVSLMLQGTQMRVALLTGSTTAKQRRDLLPALQNGEIDILIGTHALIEDNVQFANLGLVIVDEQHRFGVAQRAKLWAKNIRPPHVLVMTATPIPRTLAMTVYGDLSVSVIDELPPGRKPIQTLHYSNQRREQVDNFIDQQIQKGRQVYVVYPLIEQQKDAQGRPKPVEKPLADLENGYRRICQRFPQYRVSMVHGKMKAKEKDEHMQRFAQGETQILVATTVIEVGVNVPNASVMIVENAERFGLAQLHQLRGRVGRGAEQSYCVLLTDIQLTKDTRKRMDIMVATNDGFRIAEADLQLRGPGDMEGTLQSGLPFELKIASLSTDGQILELARKAAKDILDEDLELTKAEHQIFVNQLKKLKQQAVNWSEIS